MPRPSNAADGSAPAASMYPLSRLLHRAQTPLKSYYDARYRGSYMADHSPLEVQRVAELLARIPPETVRTILDFGL